MSGCIEVDGVRNVLSNDWGCRSNINIRRPFWGSTYHYVVAVFADHSHHLLMIRLDDSPPRLVDGFVEGFKQNIWIPAICAGHSIKK